MAELYFIRHGLAADRADYLDNDDIRPLTEAGQRKTLRVAKRLLALEIGFERILTSPLVRAKQTAEILLEVGLSQHLEDCAALAPEGYLSSWLEGLGQYPPTAETRLALVGHQPDLASWAEQLTWGDDRQRLLLKKAGIIGLLIPDEGNPLGKSTLFWLTSPRLFL